MLISQQLTLKYVKISIFLKAKNALYFVLIQMPALNDYIQHKNIANQ